MKPITRYEKFLAKIAGDEEVEDITPITREEHFLDDIAKSTEEDSGGGQKLVYYFDMSGDNGTGTVVDPFILFNDKELTIIAEAPDGNKWADIEVTTVPGESAPGVISGDVHKGKPVYAIFDSTGTVIEQLFVPSVTVQDTPAIICFSFANDSE